MQKNKWSAPKEMFIGVLLFILLFSLCGCSSSAKKEKEIVADLQKSVAFISETVEISNYEIIKRQTDQNNKSDLVYLTVYVNEDELKCTLSYVMQYTLYNDGWILEDVSQYGDGPWSIEGLPIDRISSDVINDDFYFNNYALEITDCEILDEGDIYWGEEYEKWFEVALTASCSIFDYGATYQAGYQITGDGWICQYIIPQSSGYAPTHSPDVAATDSIMDTLELGNGTSAVSYDSYEYVRTETDWGNCAETRYYEATKNWKFGSETYLVSIPLKFSLENGEDSSKWTYSRDTIRSSLQSIDWNIEGSWKANGISEQMILWHKNSWDVSLSVYNIVQKNGEYIATVSCDALYNDGSFSVPQCKTEGAVQVTIKQVEPGIYEFNIPGKEDSWSRTFKIYLKADDNGWDGIKWCYGGYENVNLEMSVSKKKIVEETTAQVISVANTFGINGYYADNPIYGVWKATRYSGDVSILCFCPDGTLVRGSASMISGTQIFYDTYVYSNPLLTMGTGEQSEFVLTWEDKNLFSMKLLNDQDIFWPSVSRIPL